MNKNKNCLKLNSLKDVLLQAEACYPEKIAYKVKIEPGQYKEYTYINVKNMAAALATALIDLGLKDKRIGIVGENRFEWEISYLSIVCGTGIIVPLDKSLPENELEELITRSEIEAIFYTKKQEEAIKKIYEMKETKLKYLISMEKDSIIEDALIFNELIDKGLNLIENGDTSFDNAKINPEEMGIMLFTSGTTSQSKVVALSQKNICSNLMAMKEIMNVDSSDVFLSILPLHHVFECTVGFLFPIYIGAKIAFCDGIRHITENLNEYNPTVMACVPGIYERIFLSLHKKSEKIGLLNEFLQKEELATHLNMTERKELFKELHNLLGGNIKLFISGAARLNEDIESGFRNLGFNMMQAYGLTETSPVVSMSTNESYKLGSVGKIIPGLESKIVSPDENGIGELAVKGPNVMLGYYQNEEATNEVLNDGWFYTGDLARIDEEGFLFIAGRKKNVIVLKNGKNVFPEEVESLLNEIEGVKESLVYGKDTYYDKEETRINAVIVVDKDEIKSLYDVSSEDEIYEAILAKVRKVNRKMPLYKWVKNIIVSDKELIKTTTNKIKRKASLELVGEA